MAYGKYVALLGVRWRDLSQRRAQELAALIAAVAREVSGVVDVRQRVDENEGGRQGMPRSGLSCASCQSRQRIDDVLLKDRPLDRPVGLRTATGFGEFLRQPTETCLTQRKKPTEDLGGLLALGSTSSRRAGARNVETTGSSVRVEQ